MNTCSACESESPIDAAGQVAARLLGRGTTSVTPVGGGRNSRVYRVVDGRGQPYALKAYFRHEGEVRDRLAAEFDGLRFLWQAGVRNVPQPLVADRPAGYALYVFVEGQKIPPPQISLADVDAATGFLGRLKDLASAAGCEWLPPASEACFSGNALIANLEIRRDRLLRQPDAGAAFPALRAFLSDEFGAAYDRMTSWSRRHLAWEAELPPPLRTLSPSDFGFHNALRHESGEWVFLDFEHFGWDDPAKTIADFLLHPSMDLSVALKRRLVENAMRCFSADRLLAERLRYWYPLFGLKWCLILLNEFLPADYLRRRFAASDAGDRRAVQTKQLAKARRMLRQIEGDHERCPYFG